VQGVLSQHQPLFMFKRLAIVALMFGSTMCAVELRIAYAVVQRVLAQQVFTDDGRKYVRANRTSKCSYAYLEHPEVAADNGRLRIRARFSGRSGIDVMGRCISLGDSFTAVIRATPYYRDGAVWLKGVDVVSADRDGFYVRGVRAQMASSLSSQFSYRVADDARRMLEQPAAGAQWKQQVVNFNVTDIRVTPDAIVAVVDFTVAVQ
jgi:hypothetical protein